MSTFFKPWRRKVGVVTLAMACLLAAGGVRSYAIADSFEFTTGRGGMIHQFASEHGAMQRRCCLTSGFPGMPFVDISASTDPRLSRWDWTGVAAALLILTPPSSNQKKLNESIPEKVE